MCICVLKMSENQTVELEDGTNKAKNRKRKLNSMINDFHISIPAKLFKRIILSLTKPSYLLQVGSKNVRWENLGRLHVLLRKLVRQRDWVEASGVLSMLLKGTCKDKCPITNRLKYSVSMELLKHIETDRMNPTRIKNIYDIWMRSNGSMKDSSIEDRFVVHLEFILFCLSQGNVEEAHQAAISLMQEHEFGSHPMSNMVIGLTFCQLWYSSIPKEMQWKDSDEFNTRGQSDISGVRFNYQVGNSEGHDAAYTHQANTSFQYDSDSSVMKDKRMSMGADSDLRREASVEVDVNSRRENLPQDIQPQGFSMNSTENEAFFSNDGDHIHYASIFSALEGLDSWLLPLRLGNSTENYEDFIYLHKEMLNDYYKDAVKYFRLALYSTPPVLAALLPLVQLFLIGGQVHEALNELEKFSSNSNMALPIRLRASLLECFDRHNYVMLSTCFEDILKSDPTCCHSLARLISMHQNGDYSLESLLEMIALHLDATYAEYSTWIEFALCFLKLSQCEEDRMSVCLNENEDGQKPRYSVRYNRTPKMFTEGKSGKAWRFRCRWWLTRHFSKNLLASEIAAGDLQLLTYKAACASHMYGLQCEYVLNAYACLEKESCRDLFMFLQMHMQNSIGIYSSFQHRTQ